MYRRFVILEHFQVLYSWRSFCGNRRFSPRICDCKKTAAWKNPTWIEVVSASARAYVLAHRIRSFGFGTAVFLFSIFFCLSDAWNPRYSSPLSRSWLSTGCRPLVCIKNVSISPDREVVLSRQHMAWNLKGVVKNNAWDFSDDEIEREMREREREFVLFSATGNVRYHVLNYAKIFRKT